jgi:hypothetical protein
MFFKVHYVILHLFSWQLSPQSHQVSLGKKSKKHRVCHTVALPFTLKSILRQNKNHGFSNISPCKSIILIKKPSKRNQILLLSKSFLRTWFHSKICWWSKRYIPNLDSYPKTMLAPYNGGLYTHILRSSWFFVLLFIWV